MLFLFIYNKHILSIPNKNALKKKKASWRTGIKIVRRKMKMIALSLAHYLHQKLSFYAPLEIYLGSLAVLCDGSITKYVFSIFIYIRKEKANH